MNNIENSDPILNDYWKSKIGQDQSRVDANGNNNISVSEIKISYELFICS